MSGERKKLIEVALPLEAINRESAREKSIRHGHPSTLHLWWSRKPLAACRAVLFASIVDDPSSRPEEFPTEETQQAERERLFRIIEELITWENSNNERVLTLARDEILRATGGDLPLILDPFCGGGSIPLEAQRLGLEVHASDLNPVAVLITKALVEIPGKFAGQPPINPDSLARIAHSGQWRGAKGLADDIRYYGKWMRDEAYGRIGHLYPLVSLPRALGNGKAPVIAWLWARTVKCPNPACGAEMILASKFWLSDKPKKRVWIEPVADAETKRVSFRVSTGAGKPRNGTVGRQGAECLICGVTAPLTYIRAEGVAGRMGLRLMATVAKGHRSRVYLPPTEEQSAIVIPAAEWKPETTLSTHPQYMGTPRYGMTQHGDLFTPRQLVMLTTLMDLLPEVGELALRAALDRGLLDDGARLHEGGTGATAYSEAIVCYLAIAIDRGTDQWSSLASWRVQVEALRSTFARQAVSMTWDPAEVNPFSDSTGNWLDSVEWVAESLTSVPARSGSIVRQLDATQSLGESSDALILTDPPYYDNIPYADLSDHFYVWLRRSLIDIYPDLFSTLLTPKETELIADHHRFGGRGQAKQRFLDGLAHSFDLIRRASSAKYPVSFYYAFRQTTEEGDSELGSGPVSTGWETMLEALIDAGFAVHGTWPIRSERGGRSRAIASNALASSIVCVCRQRPADAPLATRREFMAQLREQLSTSLKRLQQGNIAPVDLAQAAIGPGMAVFSRCAKVLEADGSQMRIRTALGLINQVLDEVLTEQESEYDAPTRWAIAWFEQHGLEEGKYGDAETLSKAKNVAVSSLVQEGFLQSRGGKVKLLSRETLETNWDPTADRRLSIWEVTQQLVRELETDGEAGAAALLRKLGALGETARTLAYRLYTTCERKKWAQEAVGYNSLVVAWPEISRLAAEPGAEAQSTLGV